ncbi:16S rRNA (cytosine(1407)-C(5))-methyltransferase RsmF [Gallaecimonas kandeliae]|uniref:16S rRNA (cytosine(1407)-C(5))-methyltransferase RsmF n=1 Tax=Gallaecimonas kandeliae TaxID=3029055 RepID=UPI002647BEA0|nr:16S rRNA (cytosine(1407)-C(5))-methyltransferase RsmF [Gallaecimonas kandeliae]WKE67472.1 16S rRNA (cytosine(1407)-C(5))-methyltransferase RsmF [Gallaecimonas kandeliae]
MDAIMPAELSREAFLAACQRPLRRAIRVNTLKIGVADFVKRMAAKGWRLDPVPWCDTGFWLQRPDETLPLGSELDHLLGLFYIQEASSMLPPQALWQQLDETPALAMDMAAAPGSKTSQLAALMNNQGLLLANELSASRIKGLHANLQRLGVANSAITHFDGRVFGSALPETFDAILLDAPCGGEGTIRKDENALKNWSQAHIDEVSTLQRELLLSAFRALKVGGVLVYSTCTLNRQENQEVIAWLQAEYPGAAEVLPLGGLFEGADKALTPEGFLHIWPQIFDSEGFFVAALRKQAQVASPEPDFKVGRFPFVPARGKEADAFRHYLKQQFGFDASRLNLWQRDKEYWHFPAEAEALIGRVRLDRIGIKVADVAGKEWKLHQDFVMALGAGCAPMALDEERARAFFCGRDLEAPGQKAAGEKVLALDGHPIGSAKALAGKLKNRFPRELVRDKL